MQENGMQKLVLFISFSALAKSTPYVSFIGRLGFETVSLWKHMHV